MVKKFSFDSLTPVQFEEFCYDLLKAMNFVNLNWRKGTGFEASSSDSGRDIECELLFSFGNRQCSEKWFVECKHHKKAVSQKEIYGFICSLDAEKPDRGLIIVSNSLSNPCKAWVVKLNDTKKPLKIEYWELKDLESFVESRPSLLGRYKFSDSFEFSEKMHPLHLQYISEGGGYTLDYFFNIIENNIKRDKFLHEVYFGIIDPKFRKPKTEYDYRTFKEGCYNLLSYIGEDFLVKSIVNLILGKLYGNKMSISTEIANQQLFLDILKENRVIITNKNKEENLKENQKTRKQIEDHIEDMQRMIDEYYSLYISFCDDILPKLIDEPKIRIEEMADVFRRI